MNLKLNAITKKSKILTKKMYYIYFGKCLFIVLLNNIKGKIFLKLFGILIIQIFRKKSNIIVC